MRLNGIGVALFGGSRAGKTSLIMASVLDRGGRIVCNDDVSLMAGPDHEPAAGSVDCGVIGVGWPRSISVRLDTLDLLFGRDRSRAVLASLSHPANQTLMSLRETGVEPHGTALLYPWEYADPLNTEIGSHTRVDAIVHVSLADDPAEAELSPVCGAASSELVGEHTLDLPNKHLNIFDHAPRAGGAADTRSAVTALPAFHFRYDFGDVRRQAERLADYLGCQLRHSPDRKDRPAVTG